MATLPYEGSITFDKPVPYDITIPQEKLDRMHKILDATDLQPYLDNVLLEETDECADYGIPPQKLVALVERLKSGYDWRATEKRFREMGEHLRVKLHGVPVQGDLNLHVIHRKSSKPDAIPILLIHGWPGSFYEFHGLAPLLTEAGFDVVIPSLPGYTYSDAPRKRKGIVPWGQKDTAACLDAAMRALGYTRYVAQGGDWGGLLARGVALLFPERCIAIHINHIMSGLKDDPPTDDLTDEEKRGIQRREVFVTRASAYAETQGTVPTTLGGVLIASPVSCLSWIGEKLYRWCAPDSQPEIDDVITFSLLYYLTGKVVSSSYLYYNRKSPLGDHVEINTAPVSIPVAVGLGPWELYWPAKSTVRPLFPKLHSFRILKDGGHFLAHERPQTLFDDAVPYFKEHWSK